MSRTPRGVKKVAVLLVVAWILPGGAWASADRGGPCVAGLEHLAQGRVMQARAAFAQALSQDPSRALAVAGLAAAHLFSGEVQRSVVSFQTARELAPGDAWPDACLGAAYLQAHDYPRAADAFNRALGRRGSWAAVRSRLALALWRQKLFAAALEASAAARRQGDLTFAPLIEAAVALDLGDAARAERALAGAGAPALSPATGLVQALLPAPVMLAAVPEQPGSEAGPAALPEAEEPQAATLSFAWPHAGAKVSRRVEVRVESRVALKYVVVYVDDQFLAVSNTTTYRALWDTTRWRDGSHRLRVEGYDATGKVVARSEIEVLVLNRKRTGDAAARARDALLGRRLAELCLPQPRPEEAYLLRARAAEAQQQWAGALDAAERAFAFWPWKDRVRAVLLQAYQSLGLSRAAPQEIHVLPRPGEIAITFDDGPHPRITPFLLDVLARRHVRATFFLVGKQALLYPDLVRRIARAGHEIGSHSQTHPNLAQLCPRDIERELVESRWSIAQALGRRVVLFRPPGGHYSQAVRAAAALCGFRPVFWTANICRYARRPRQQILDGLIEDLKPGGILLLHNGEDETPSIVEALLDRLLAAGYRLGPVGELSGLPRPYFAVRQATAAGSARAGAGAGRGG